MYLAWQHLLTGRRQFVLGRDHLDGVFHAHGELFARKFVTLLCVALLLGCGDILRLGRYGIEIGPLDLLEQRLLQIEPREAAVLGGQPGLVHRRAVLAVREDRDAQRQPHVLVEAVPDLRAAFVAAARHVAGSDPGRERERRQES